MRETRLSGSEGGATLIWSSLPLSISWSLRDETRAPVREIDSTSPLGFEDDDEYGGRMGMRDELRVA